MRLLLVLLVAIVAAAQANAGTVQVERFTGYGAAFVSTASLDEACDDDTNVGGACFDVDSPRFFRLLIQDDRRPWGAIDGDYYDLLGAEVAYLDAEGDLIRAELICSLGTYTFPLERPTAQVHVNVQAPTLYEFACANHLVGIPSGTITLDTWT